VVMVPTDAHPSGSPGNYVAGVRSAVETGTAVRCMLLRVCAPGRQAVTICCDVRPWFVAMNKCRSDCSDVVSVLSKCHEELMSPGS
jgi:hypothetical protein